MDFCNPCRAVDVISVTMNMQRVKISFIGAVLLATRILELSTSAQPAPQRGRGPQGPQVVSPEGSADRRATFRILAPKAEAVRLSGSDIPGNEIGRASCRERG